MAQGAAGVALSRRQRGRAWGSPCARHLRGPRCRARQARLFRDARGGAQRVVPERGACAGHGAGRGGRGSSSATA
eukprot:7966910-Pyramimonas_sp.AAC.1